MQNTTSIRIELGVDASRIIQQVRLNNELLEEQIEKGIQLALDDISREDNFIQLIRESTHKELLSVVNRAVLSYAVRDKISKLVEEKIGKKLEDYADGIAEKIVASLK